jgi:hypothetical protein
MIGVQPSNFGERVPLDVEVLHLIHWLKCGFLCICASATVSFPATGELVSSDGSSRRRLTNGSA